MIFGLMIKSLCPPTWTCFFMRLKLLKRQISRPLLFVLRLKSTSSQKYLNYNHNDRFPWLPVTSQLWQLHTEKCVADIGRQPQTKSTFPPQGAGSLWHWPVNLLIWALTATKEGGSEVTVPRHSTAPCIPELKYERTFCILLWDRTAELLPVLKSWLQTG